ncbi:MAG: hypothetical protein A2901_08060 [Elusimicrobia bacterium RIFCSPLOWO2_01_FULL_54_10]|nr:MAG: hypothetical protein A2901_08060 [Elusimicrobia bacterium RIFCSPLOWO2_01_FULL_54_10]
MPPSLNRRLINRFFELLSKELDQDTRVVLTGAAAGNILGEVRPSSDIDFAVRFVRSNPQSWEKFEKAIRNTIQLTGINANYAEDIDRWGLVSLMDYLKHTLPYQRFGVIKVEILAPAYWSIGKMTRYLEPDIRDMVRVFKKQKVPCLELVRIWGLALKKSPQSMALFQFRKQVEDFLKHYGRSIWGKNFDAVKTVQSFHKEMGLKTILE